MADTILEKARLILGLTDTSGDELLKIYIEEVCGAICAHCRITELPQELETLAARAAAGLFDKSGASVSAITEGDRRVEFKSQNTDFLLDYTERLKPFVNISAVLPSELESE